MLNRESAYIAGCSVAAGFVMLFYLTCFKRKHYLLLVVINSIMVIANVVICTLYILGVQNRATKHIIHDLVYRPTVGRAFVLGILDNGSMFILDTFLPSIIAV